MYVAKRGRSGYARFVPDIEHFSEHALGLLSVLRKAVEENQLTLVYPPKIRIGDRCGSYVRDKCPLRGLLNKSQTDCKLAHLVDHRISRCGQMRWRQPAWSIAIGRRISIERTGTRSTGVTAGCTWAHRFCLLCRAGGENRQSFSKLSRVTAWAVGNRPGANQQFKFVPASVARVFVDWHVKLRAFANRGYVLKSVDCT